MKVKDLIRALSAADPESNVIFSLGEPDSDAYRINCAKVEIMSNECLNAMEAYGINFTYDEGEEEPFLVNVFIRHNNSISPKDFNDYIREFNDLCNNENSRD